ncbi:hypothetical protein [Neorhizobium huautlense]|uniref:hypothetical protein n=1 Tax=Neorhizobium huautlense TaxID=67774 RepID=UPI00130040D4|nr:hypothetical protein [Neorhizobium huautlense]
MEQVIFLQQGGPNDTPPPRPADPDLPPDDPGERRRALHLEDRDKRKRPASRLKDHLKPPHGGGSEGLTPANTTGVEQERAILAASGSFFQLEWRTYADEPWYSADWILLPYVHPVDDASRKRFVKDMRAALGARRTGNTKLREALLARLGSMNTIKELVAIYQRHFPGGHNAVSMSLYSGALAQRPTAPGRPTSRWATSIGYPEYRHHFWQDDGMGWLGTGDAALLQDKWRKPWREFYEPFGDCVGIMTLPHHGSAHNFHPDILEFGDIRYALATTVEARNRVARLRETLSSVDAKGIRTHVVDDLRHSRFRVTCERVMP